ncbi:MAG: MFS transporter [Spirochaetales bacterium]|nr:MFS transporter [Spirochaetales bacterium]
MKRYVSLIAGIIVQICLGGIYAFSSYVPTLSGDWGFTALQTQTVFGITILFFTLYMIPAGKLLRKWGPRRLILISGTLFITGHFLASLSGGNYPVFLLAYILFISPAMSFGYVCPVAAGLLWFPEHRGLVTGLSVAGYGTGGMILAGVIELLLSRGWPLFRILQFNGALWGAVIILAGILSATPDGLIRTGSREEHDSIKTHLKDFTGITFFLFFGTLPGLMLIGALKPFGLFHGVAPATAAVAVAALSVGNGSGRITWGIIADRLSPRRTAFLNFTGVLISVILLFLAGLNRGLFIPAGFVLGFCYGGPLVIAPDQTARVYGAANLGSVYPTALAFHGVAAALGAPLAGLLVSAVNSYTPVLLIAGSGTLAGALGYYFMTRNTENLKHL